MTLILSSAFALTSLITYAYFKTNRALFIVFFVHRPFNFLFTKEYFKQLISCVGSLSIKIILLIISQQNIASVCEHVQWFAETFSVIQN